MDVDLKICFVFMLYASTQSAQQFMTLKCDKTVTGTFNEDTILPCSLETIKPSTFIKLQLFKDEGNESVFYFNTLESGSEKQNRIKLLCQDLQNISLVIQKTQVSDGGRYHYDLETNLGFNSAAISVTFKAPYTLPKMTIQNFRKMEKAIFCQTIGYPSAQIHWSVDGRRSFAPDVETNIEETSQGLFNITSVLPIGISDSNSEHNYTCAVWNDAENKYEVKKYFSSTDSSSSSLQTINTGTPQGCPLSYSLYTHNCVDRCNSNVTNLSMTSQLSAESQTAMNSSLNKSSHQQNEAKKKKDITVVCIVFGGLLAAIFILVGCRLRRKYFRGTMFQQMLLIPSELFESFLHKI